MADFPLAVHEWEDVVDDETKILAEHQNTAHAEIIAIENFLPKLTTASASFMPLYNYRRGMNINYVSSTQVSITAGEIFAGGKILKTTSATTISSVTNLRSGESMVADTYYYVYCYLSGSTVTFKFSRFAPNPDLSHALETGWRMVGGIPRIGTSFIKQISQGFHSTFIKQEVFGDTPNGSIQSINLAKYVPSYAKSVTAMFGNAANSSGEVFIGVYNQNDVDYNTQDFRISGLAEDDNFTFTVRVPLITSYLYFKGVSSKWTSIYLCGYEHSFERY